MNTVGLQIQTVKFRIQNANDKIEKLMQVLGLQISCFECKLRVDNASYNIES